MVKKTWQLHKGDVYGNSFYFLLSFTLLLILLNNLQQFNQILDQKCTVHTYNIIMSLVKLPCIATLFSLLSECYMYSFVHVQ